MCGRKRSRHHEFERGKSGRGYFFRRCLIARPTRINQQIRAREVRVIDADSGQLGVMPLHEALGIAEQKELDLVEVAPDAQPPVCRLLDYGKFRYLQKKKTQEAKRNATFVAVKEVKMGARTNQHDLEFKVRNIRRFLERGQRVKVSVFFRGREITHPELGRAMLNGVFDEVQDLAKLDVSPKLEGRNMAMLLTPKSNA